MRNLKISLSNGAKNQGLFTTTIFIRLHHLILSAGIVCSPQVNESDSRKKQDQLNRTEQRHKNAYANCNQHGRNVFSALSAPPHAHNPTLPCLSAVRIPCRGGFAPVYAMRVFYVTVAFISRGIRGHSTIWAGAISNGTALEME